MVALPQLPGIDLVGVADGADWQHVLPGCRSVVVYASGRGLWRSLIRRVHKEPGFARAPHPIDQLVSEAIDSLPARGGRWVRCADDAAVHLDFRGLAYQAGLGWPSRLGLLLHPTHGPWFGLRAAWFTTETLPPTGPLPGTGPCARCPAPCAAACPAEALPPAGWQPGRCLPHQASTHDCRGGCLARAACPEGRPHAYHDAQHRYHHSPDEREGVLAAISDRPPPAPRSR